MKSLLPIIFFLFSYLAVEAQNTYKIEKLSSPQGLLPTVSPKSLYGRIEQDIIKISVTDDLVFEGTHPVLGGFLKAYKEHRPVTISPDIIWLLICQGFSQHVNNNARSLRNKFINFEGQTTLTVTRNVESGAISDFPWETIFPEFVEQIGNYTGKELTTALAADFSTTTPSSLIASQITIMESVKAYFKYKVTMVGCGIPEVTIEGTIEDWQKILDKLDYISQYDLEWWTSELKPIIKEIINTKSGKFDKNFWMKMVRYHSEGFYGSLTDIDGWLLKFYPYSSSRKRMNLKTIKSIGELPDEITRTPFILEIRSNETTIIKSLKMEFWSGFMGLKQTPGTFNLKPEIGWAINRVGEE
ncbi:MAG: DUF4419 domain-containing protein [Dysgonomonas sp.]|nr:DUF4419 domain-containing protein [Dysgonomonas sp.]